MAAADDDDIEGIGEIHSRILPAAGRFT
jgi:hypothetical protein